jgi:hypothetical protein
MAALACAAALSVAAHATWTVTNLHPAAATFSEVHDIYGDQQVGFVMIGANRAALWRGTAESFVNLHPAGTAASRALGVGGGQQAGWATIAGRRRASVWGGTAASWVNLHGDGPNLSEASDAFGGQQAGTRIVAGVRDASLWSGTAGSRVSLNPPGVAASVALGFARGEQVGFVQTVGQPRAALWRGTAASWVDLHPTAPNAVWSEALDTTGEVQVGWVRWSDGTVDVIHACLWRGSAGSRVDLHPPGATGSRAHAAFGDFQVGMAVFDNPAVGHPILWRGTAESFVDLSQHLPPGSWGNGEATGVWTDGTTIYVVGNVFSVDRARTEALMWSRPAAVQGTVSGNLGLAGWTAPLTDPLITFEIREPGSTTALQTAVVSLSTTGEFTFTTPLPAGTYDVTAKSDRWLRARLQNVTFTAAGASGLAFGELIPGDVVENNAIDLADFLALAATYEVSPPTEARADLNGDGSVDLADFLLLAAHYETVGAP